MPQRASSWNPVGITSASKFAGRGSVAINISQSRDPRIQPLLDDILRQNPEHGKYESFTIIRKLAQSAATQATTSAARYVPESLAGRLQALAIGDPIPEVWARRRIGGTGGVLAHGKCSEIRLTNTATTITASFHLVFSAGQVGPIQVRDVRQGVKRQGAFSQNYDKRAGLAAPGNFTSQATAGFTLPTLPTICGGGGDYRGLSTMEFVRTYPGESDEIFLTISAFVREGIYVTRLEDDVLGPSDNVVDVVLRKGLQTGRLRLDMIDLPQMKRAAKFVAANGLYLNAVLPGGDNYEDLLTNLLPAFLLQPTTINGKFALAPVLPYNADYTIATGPIEPYKVLTEAVIVPDSYREARTPAEARIRPKITATWRQQNSETEPFLARTTVFGDLQRADPPEAYDLLAVATSERQAAVAVGYRYGMRTMCKGTATVTVPHGSDSGLLRQGHIIQVVLGLNTAIEAPGQIMRWWRVVGCSLAPGGSEALELQHFPVDSQGRSLVALAIADAVANGKGALLPYPEISEADAEGRATDQTVPAPTTSGTPFSSGGGIVALKGFTGGSSRGGGSGGAGFDEAKIGPSPQDDPPPPPPVPSQGGEFTGNYYHSPVTGETRFWIQPPFEPYRPDEECEFGLYDSEYFIYIEPHENYGVLTDDGSTNSGYDYGVSTIVQAKEPPVVEEIETRIWAAGPNMGQEFVTVRITIMTPAAYAGTAEPEVIIGYTGPNPLEITRLWYRCALRDGTPDEYVYEEEPPPDPPE